MLVFVKHSWKLDHGPPEMSWPDPLYLGLHPITLIKITFIMKNTWAAEHNILFGPEGMLENNLSPFLPEM
ncbi:hypothetical protein HanRHA438_Chr13g0581831 [Helianthus annuus]|uniref:Uncharacterized protein n=1 Tax=Helianthus annuus TaxID=4232 RepID=A0A251SND6_HELAN|nr:hypothetical protein HanXRQr2_Chr13g0570591 [Helianthus annuus]KAJ0847788.1 hypothetical protein HanPSC8_Chr13g0549391 [Helianthus annuus]KAJ0856735.1 hypothetical protein HanRHA438_Chr13g0581831 [Helianthus annuus]